MMASLSDDASAEHDLAELFRSEGPTVWRALYAYAGGRREIADDALAEAFARAVAHAPEVREPLAWVYRVSFRLAAEELRRERHNAGPPPDEAVDPPEAQDVVRALRRLTPNQRAAVILAYEVDLPVSEVANRLGISAATVRVHLFRARRRLEHLLREEDDDAQRLA